MRTTLAALESARATRPPGYVDAILAAGQYDPDGLHHHIAPETLAAIRQQFGVPEPPLPSLPRMAANAAGAIGRAIGGLAAGAPLTAPPQEVERRRAICGDCEHFRRMDQRCALCGCGMAGVVGKWHLATEHCPLQPLRW